MALLTKGLRRTIILTATILLAGGSSVIGVCAFFLSTPNMRRRIVITSDEIFVALALGCSMAIASILLYLVFLSTQLTRIFLNIFRILMIVVLLITLGLGAFIWFQSLDVQADFGNRWNTWEDSTKVLFQNAGECCGYLDPNDSAVLQGFCTRKVIELDSTNGCSSSIFTFVNYYLQNIYTALFFYVFIDFFSLLIGLVALRALSDQRRYDKSMRKMINMHNLDQHLLEPEEYSQTVHDVDEEYETGNNTYQHYRPRHKTDSYLPAPNHRASVIYSYN